MSTTSESPLGNKTLWLFRNDLEEQRSELIASLDRIRQQLRTLVNGGSSVAIGDSDSWAEAAFANYTQSWKQLRKVEAALLRISNREFGICCACGDVIKVKRLKALPWADTCIECQEQSELAMVQ